MRSFGRIEKPRGSLRKQLSMHWRIVKEAHNYTVSERVDKDGNVILDPWGKKYTTKDKKFLVIGGPHSGHVKSAAQLDDNEYIRYNASDTNKHACIWIHRRLLK
jgi:hypothetical protein